MTNVREFQRRYRLFRPSATAGGENTGSRFCGTAARICGLIVLSLAAILLPAGTGTAFAQGPSGAIGSTIDVNRRGLGFAVRGGHFAGESVGRSDSASLFNLTPYVNIGNGLLFGDARLVYGNEGGLDYSFGGGYRHYVPAWDAVAGANIFSDRGDFSGTHFKSWGVGAEILAHGWEIRANGYSPYATKSIRTGVRADSNSAFFQGNNVIFDRIDSFREALHGFDAEIGWLLPGPVAEQFDIRAFGGGYWYKGDQIPGFSGFSVRLQTDIRDIVELGLKLSDDEFTHTNLTFSAIVHYGAFQSQEHTRRSAIQRMAEPVRRNLNIPVVDADVRVPGQIAQAIDGTNLTIIHVNSNAGPGGTGTVDNPFDMLSSGLSFAHPEVVDVVFVHAGSQFSDPANNSVTLDPNQSVFGEGLIRVQQPGVAGPAGFVRDRRVTNIVDLPDIGPLILPASPTFETNLAVFNGLPAGSGLTAGVTRPILEGAAGDALTLSTNSRTAGLILRDVAGNGLVIPAVGGTNVRDMLIDNAGFSGISIFGTPTTTTTTIINTEIENTIGAAPAFSIAGGGGTILFGSDGFATDPPLGRVNNTAPGAPALDITGRIGGIVDMTGSSITDDGGSGIILANNANTSMELANLDIAIDNINLSNSTANGILISNPPGTVSGTERYVFRNTIDPDNANGAFHIQGSTDSSIRVQDVPDGSFVRFFDVLNIGTPMASAIDIERLGGSVFFQRDVTIGVPGGGSAPAISVASGQATSQVQFINDLTIGGVTPTYSEGILLTMNETGADFTVVGDTLIGGTGSTGILITQDDGTVSFDGDITINNRLGVGIGIVDTTGDITFGDNATSTTVNNQQLSAGNGLTITNSESFVHFEHLDVQDSITGAAVNLMDNRPGITGRTPGDAIISFDNMSVQSANTPSPGLFGDNNELIIVRNLPVAPITSFIDVNEAPAVDITNSGIDITFDRVATVDSPTFGINLVDTNVAPPVTSPGLVRNRFRIREQSGANTQRMPGAGGLIENSAIAGVNMQNAGQVELNDVNLLENTIGIEVANSGLTLDEDQFLELYQVQVTESELLGLRAENLHRLVIADDSYFELNGDVVNFVGGDHQNEAILLRYTEHPYDVTTTEFDEVDNPFQVIIEGNNDATAPSGFEDNTDDIIRIVNEEDGDPATEHEGAVIDVLITNNRFDLNDTFDTVLGQGEAAVRMNWDGIARVEITENNVLLDGVNLGFTAATPIAGSQDAFLIDANSRMDELLADISANLINAPTQLNSTGIRVDSEGPVQAQLNGNGMTFGGADSAGFRFELRENDADGFIQIAANDIVFSVTALPNRAGGLTLRTQDGSDGGAGMIFERIREPAELRIAGNRIQLFDNDDPTQGFVDTRGTRGEAGILFERVPVGMIDLRGGLNNLITIQTDPAAIFAPDIDTLFNLSPAQANGTILINGANLP